MSYQYLFCHNFLSADDCKRYLSDSSFTISSSLLLGKSASTQSAIIPIAGLLPVVQLCSNVATAAAASATCSVDTIRHKAGDYLHW